MKNEISRTKALLVLGAFCTPLFIFSFCNFVPSDRVYHYAPIVVFISMCISIFLFKKYHQKWYENQYATIGKEGGTNSKTQAVLSGTILGVILPVIGLYMITMNTLPFVLTYSLGEYGHSEKVFVVERFGRLYRDLCWSKNIKFKDTDFVASKACGLKTTGNTRLKKGDKLRLNGIVSDYGIIPRSYELIPEA